MYLSRTVKEEINITSCVLLTAIKADTNNGWICLVWIKLTQPYRKDMAYVVSYCVEVTKISTTKIRGNLNFRCLF